jgi:hypothetical protein
MHLFGLAALMNVAKVALLVLAVKNGGYAWLVMKRSVSTTIMMGVYFLAVYQMLQL